MKQGQQLNLRNIALATSGGAVLILVASQLVAKPNLPPTATARPRSGNPATASTPRLASTLTADSPLVGTPTVRELFRPLISDQPVKKPTVAAPAVKAPTLPAAGAKPATTPSTSPATTPTPDTPTTPPGPSASELHMLGVVEIGSDLKVLLKKTSTGESRYFAKGEDAFGFTVGEIKADQVSLTREGRSETVAMSNEIAIETPSGTSVAASGFRPSFGGGGFNGGGFNRGSFGGGSSNGFGDRNRGDRNRDRGNSGGSESGRSGGGFSTSEIMSLPTWTERLKKLNEVKAQLEPAQYERLKKFMEGRVAAEKGK